MGLAIDGNIVHGIARGGQAFVSLESAAKDGSINIGGNNYYPFAENPSGEYTIEQPESEDGGYVGLDIHLIISKDGKLTVTEASTGGGGYIVPAELEIKKHPL